MIVGLNMHQASNAGLGHHHHPTNLDHNMNGSTGSAAVGPPSTERLSYTVDNNTGSADSYAMHHMHQYQHYESFNSSSQQSNHSIVNGAVEATAHTPQQIYVPDDTQQLPQHNGMLGLEQQFAHFALQPNQQDDSDQPSSGKILDIDGDEAEEEPVKLFVGQVGYRRFIYESFPYNVFAVISPLLQLLNPPISFEFPDTQDYGRRRHFSDVQ
jgi:hypothetical protein